MKKNVIAVGIAISALVFSMGTPLSSGNIQALAIKFQAKLLVDELNGKLLANLHTPGTSHAALINTYTLKVQTLSDSFYRSAPKAAKADAETTHLIDEMQQFMADIRTQYSAS